MCGLQNVSRLTEWICGYLEVMMGNDLRQYVDNDYGFVFLPPGHSGRGEPRL
jgi:hypothetical protein